ncbi:hypothetical protein [uncultured Endozoicomonas sp.]|uniref:hypothetical protein n=1 Tax=uncultured Endozoicomonas sp. TaxID=432652 RepID=UPI00261145C1|nr:hypothetical protein [uncultured Endozoicomonas sp.]
MIEAGGGVRFSCQDGEGSSKQHKEAEGRYSGRMVTTSPDSEGKCNASVSQPASKVFVTKEGLGREFLIKDLPSFQCDIIEGSKEINLAVVVYSADAAVRNEHDKYPSYGLVNRMRLSNTKTNIIKEIVNTELKGMFGEDKPIILGSFSEGRAKTYPFDCMRKFVRPMVGVESDDIVYQPYNDSELSLACALTINSKEQQDYNSITLHESGKFNLYIDQDGSFSGRSMPYRVYKLSDKKNESSVEEYLALVRYHPHPIYSVRCQAMVLFEQKMNSLKDQYKSLRCIVVGEINHEKKRYVSDKYSRRLESKAAEASAGLLEKLCLSSNDPGKLFVVGKACIDQVPVQIKGPTICSSFDIIPGLFELREIESSSMDKLKNDIIKDSSTVLKKLGPVLENLMKREAKGDAISGHLASLAKNYDQMNADEFFSLFADIPPDEFSSLFAGIPPEETLKIYRMLSAAETLKFPYLGKRSCVYSNGTAKVDVTSVIMTNPELGDMNIRDCKDESDFIRCVKEYAVKAVDAKKPPFLSDHPITIMGLKGYSLSDYDKTA